MPSKHHVRGIWAIGTTESYMVSESYAAGVEVIGWAPWAVAWVVKAEDEEISYGTYVILAPLLDWGAALINAVHSLN